MKVTAYNIEYDTDGEDIDLPEEITIDVPFVKIFNGEFDDYISDEISNITGFCHKGFNIK